MSFANNNLPSEPTRAKAFAKFFKNYMNVWSLIVAALPIPVTALNLIPVYDVQRGFLSVYTTLFCFLLLGFVFFNRFILARLMFRLPFVHTKLNRIFNTIMGDVVSWLPFFCIVLSFSSLIVYHTLLQSSFEATKISANLVKDANIDSLRKYQDEILKSYKLEDIIYGRRKNSNDSLAFQISQNTSNIIYTHQKVLAGNAKEIMKYAQLNEIKTGKYFEDSYFFHGGISGEFLLTLFYILFFIFAEAAFILMALKEYLLDLMELKDTDVITGKYYKSIFKESEKL